jgi:hypothetical protein
MLTGTSRLERCSDRLNPYAGEQLWEDFANHEQRSKALSIFLKKQESDPEVGDWKSNDDALDHQFQSDIDAVKTFNDKISEFYRFPKPIRGRTLKPLSLVDSRIYQSRFTKELLEAVEKSLEEEAAESNAEISSIEDIEDDTAREQARKDHEYALKGIKEEYTLLKEAKSTLAEFED